MSQKNKYFVAPNDPILLKIAEAILEKDITSKKTQDIIESMLTIAYGEQKDRLKPVLVGLAAPQVGISKRVILVDIGADGKGKVSNLQVYINPKIIEKSNKAEEWYEGCFSTDRVCGIVSRPKEITIEAYNRKGERFSEKHKGYIARIFQHEVDHLNGIEFVKHITHDSNLHWVKDEEFPEYRNNQGWKNWQNKCPREKWEKIKGIS